MSEFLHFMMYPFLACLVLTGIHTYLGQHVIERQVIFVDLSLAQIAALGASIALVMGHELNSPLSYWLSLAFTVVGAVVFAFSRFKKGLIPQEAVIGATYAVSASLLILVLSLADEGDEHIRQMLVGNILLVDWREIVKIALLYGVIGFVHWRLRKVFWMISSSPEQAFAKGVSVKKWDLLFYLTFGLVVTSSVEIAGVLLVFSFLIVPAVAAVMFTNSLRARLVIGWLVGAVTSLLGISASYYYDLPTGATVICSFGGVLMLLAIVHSFVSGKTS